MANKKDEDTTKQPLGSVEMEDITEDSGTGFYSEVDRPTSQESNPTEREKEEPIDAQ